LISNTVAAYLKWLAESEGAGRMSDFGSSAARQRRLAGELRRLRQRARLRGKDVAARLGWSEAKLSRIETGQARVKIKDLDEVLELYEVPEPHRADLIALAEESRGSDSLDELEGDVPEGHSRILELEREAEMLWAWEPQVIPGLLQIADYTRAVLRLWPAAFAMPAAEIERRVETGQLRQRILSRDPPLELGFVIDESVLLRKFAPPSVMHDQLAHLVAISEQPNVELRILALTGNQIIGTGAFNYFKFPSVHGVPLPDMVAYEHLQGTAVTDAERDVNTYRVVFTALRDSALSVQASRDTLVRAARESWQ
jgi:transcriptional regulator with XRE-family HTH domain